MIAGTLRHPALSLVIMLLSAPMPVSAWATEKVHEWLTKMAQATRSVDYEGTFVYQHGTQLETMRIVHKVVDGAPQERLVSLNGVPREIIRDAREVRCYYPDDNSVVVEPRRADNQDFPSILPERLQGLNENYSIQLGRTGRVANRPAQLLHIRPRDGYRYGYQLWADRDTGVLLKADLVDEKERMLEQFMFTQIAIGAKIPLSALTAQTLRPGMIWHRDDSKPANGNEAGWEATRLPKGFKLSTRIRREVPMRKKPVEHLVFTDGLAAVSVFVEKHDANNQGVVQGMSRLGAVNAYGTEVNGYFVTTIGEVPTATISLIGTSVARRQ